MSKRLAAAITDLSHIILHRRLSIEGRVDVKIGVSLVVIAAFVFWKPTASITLASVVMPAFEVKNTSPSLSRSTSASLRSTHCTAICAYFADKVPVVQSLTESPPGFCTRQAFLDSDGYVISRWISPIHDARNNDHL